MNSDREIFSKSADCLSSAALDRALDGTASPDEQRHFDACSFCQSEVAMLQSFAAAEASPAEAAVVQKIEKDLRAAPAWKPAPAPQQSWWMARQFWGLGLAGLAALVALSVYLHNPSQGPAGVGDDTVRSGQIEAITPTGDLTSVPSHLQWRGVPGAVSYEVRLLDVAGETLWQTTVTTPLAALPAAAQAFMTNRKTLTWRIRAMDGKGQAIAISATETFRVVTR
jgi:hypothetical protein